MSKRRFALLEGVVNRSHSSHGGRARVANLDEEGEWIAGDLSRLESTCVGVLQL